MISKMKFSEIKEFCLNSNPPCTHIYRGNETWSAYLDEKLATIYRLTGETQVSFWLQRPNGQIIYYSSHPDQPISTFYFEDEMPGVLHQHDFLELGYVIEGQAVQLFSGREYVFPTGSFWFSDRSCIHQDVYRRENLMTVYFSFNNTIFDSSFMNLIENLELRTFLHSALIMQKRMRQFLSFLPRSTPPPEVTQLVEQMADEVMEKRPGWRFVLRGLLARLFVLLFENYDLELTNQSKVWSSQTLYSEITTYIKEHYAEVTLQSLSEMYHYTPDFLSRLLKDNCGLSYSEYVQWIRVEKACEFLENTSDSIDTIIERVGYHNKRFFYSIFQQQMQMTPKEYRQTKRKNK